MGPAESRDLLRGIIPFIPTLPRVVFSPTMPQKEDGIRTDPPVSVPTAAAANPQLTATPDPLLEPPGTHPESQGFGGVPKWSFTPKGPNANSTMFVLPSRTLPALASLFATVEEVVGMCFSRTLEPEVDLIPAVSQRSFSATGIP